MRITTDSRLVVGVGCLQAVAAVASQEYLVERKLDQLQSEMLNLVFVLLPYKYVPSSSPIRIGGYTSSPMVMDTCCCEC